MDRTELHATLRRGFAIVWAEVLETLKRPQRVLRLADPASLRDLRGSLRKRQLAGGAWQPAEETGMIGRQYASYEHYLSHQAAKLDTIDLSDYDRAYRRVLAARLQAAGKVTPRDRVVCLAARLGTEVKAFQDLGCFAVGIDLNPGATNRYVLYGDFHEVQFPDGSADVVFTNSLDHAFDPRRLLGEVKRLLGPEGIFVAEISRGKEEGYAPREYEAFFWNTVDDAAALIEREGFDQIASTDFDDPWPGKHFVFRAQGRAA